MSKAISRTDEIQMLLEATRNVHSTVKDHENRITHIESHMIIDSRSALNLRQHAVKRVAHVLGSKDHPEFRKTISEFWHHFWDVYGVCSYRDTPIKQYENAMDFISKWHPKPRLVKNDPNDAA